MRENKQLDLKQFIDALIVPDWVPKSGWLEHLPFAVYITATMKPKLLVELGTHYGASYAAFCEAVLQRQLDTHCFAVDTWEGDEQAGFYEEDVFRTFSAYHNNRFNSFSQLLRMRFDEALPYFTDHSIDLLHIDGYHSFEATMKNFQEWLPKMSSQGIVLFHDTNVRRDDFGVWKVWEELTHEYPNSFEFTHGYGLGVLAVGEQIPDGLERLFKLSPDEQRIVKNYFSYLGQRWKAEYAHKKFLQQAQSAEREVKNGIAEITSLKNQHQSQIDRLVNEHSANVKQYKEQIDSINNKLVNLESDKQALQNKSSQLESDKQALQSKASQLESDKQALQNKSSQLESDKRELQNAIGLLKEQNRTLVKQLNQEREALKNSIIKKLSEIDSYLKRPSIIKRIARATGINYVVLLLKWSFSSNLRPQVKTLFRLRSIRNLIQKSELFSSRWYLDKYSDVDVAGMDALEHYILYGAYENRKPHPLFDTTWYLSNNPDIAKSRLNPLAHYIEYGDKEGRKPNGLFNPKWYRDKYGNIEDKTTLEHFIDIGVYQGYDPSPLFDTDWYLSTYRDVADANFNPLMHYIEHGTREFRNPNLLFDTEFYTQQTNVLDFNPLTHFEIIGVNERFPPSLPFKYLDLPSFPTIDELHQLIVRITKLSAPLILYPTHNDSFDDIAEAQFKSMLHERGYVDRVHFEQPLVSIVLPTHNRRHIVIKAIESVVSQSYPYWELLVIDDNSQDSTYEFLSNTIHDDRVKVYRTEGLGVSGARNIGLQHAKGKYISYLDDDNMWLPDYLEYMVATFLMSGSDIVYSAIKSQHDDGVLYRGKEFDYELLQYANYIDLNIFMHTREFYDQYGGFDTTLRRMVDWDLILLYTRNANNVTYAPFIGAIYDNTSRVDRITNSELNVYQYCIFNKHFIDWTQLANEASQRDSNLVSIVIPIYNQIEFTEKCLESLFSTTAGISFEVILVDNGSDQRTKERLFLWQEIREDVHVVRNFKNLNFAVGCNTGVAKSRGKYVVLLNNDTEVTNNWLYELVEPLISDENIGIVGPKLLYPDGTLQSGGMVFSEKSKVPYPIYLGFSGTHPAVNKTREYQVVTGACMAFRASDYIALRGFEPTYINGGEDIDLCFRFRHTLNKKILYKHTSTIYHHESKTPGRGKHIMYNRELFVNTWRDYVIADDTEYFEEDHFVATTYVKRGSEEHGETAVYIPNLTIAPSRTDLTRPKTFNIGFSTMWHKRGISFETKQFAEALEKSVEFETYIFARWESHKFDNTSSIYHPRVFNAGDDPTPDEMLQWVKDNDIDLVVFMEVHPKDWKRVEYLKKAGIKVMCRENLDILRLEMWDRYEEFDYFLFTSFYTRNVTLEKFPQIPSITIPWGVEIPQDFDFETPSSVSQDMLQFVHVSGWGGLKNRKNSDLLIRAFDAAGEIDAVLNFYTQSPLSNYGPEIEKIAANNNRIHIYEGTIENIFTAYKDQDLLLWPSKREGLGLPIVEALACGLPVLTSDGYMMKQWLIPGRHGTLCEATPKSDGMMFLPEMQVDAATLAKQIADISRDRKQIQQWKDNVAEDRPIWLWDWQPKILQQQIKKLLTIPGYRPPTDLSYLPQFILDFEELRRKNN